MVLYIDAIGKLEHEFWMIAVQIRTANTERKKSLKHNLFVFQRSKIERKKMFDQKNHVWMCCDVSRVNKPRTVSRHCTKSDAIEKTNQFTNYGAKLKDIIARKLDEGRMKLGSGSKRIEKIVDRKKKSIHFQYRNIFTFVSTCYLITVSLAVE